MFKKHCYAVVLGWVIGILISGVGVYSLRPELFKVYKCGDQGIPALIERACKQAEQNKAKHGVDLGFSLAR